MGKKEIRANFKTLQKSERINCLADWLISNSIDNDMIETAFKIASNNIISKNDIKQSKEKINLLLIKKILSFSFNDIKSIFKDSFITKKIDRHYFDIIFDELHYNETRSIFNKEHINELTILFRYIQQYNDYIKTHAEVENKSLFYKVKNKCIKLLISEGFLESYSIEKRGDEEFYSLQFQLNQKFVFHQPKNSIKGLIDKNIPINVYSHKDREIELSKEQIIKLQCLWRFLSSKSII